MNLLSLSLTDVLTWHCITPCVDGRQISFSSQQFRYPW